ncbi:MAG: pyridoxal phosphate-dependent aminotransferase [Bryobacteraceae bacterium]
MVCLPERVAALTPTAVNSILAEVNEIRQRGGAPVSLMRGEPDLPTPSHIVEAAVAALHNGRTGYPDNRGEPSLRKAVAAKLARDNRVAYDAGDEILVTTGATLGIYAALVSLLHQGDDVLLPDPVYDAYLSPIRLAGANPRPVTARRENDRFLIDRDALEKAWTPACRALLLNTPWNPVGTVFTKAELEAIASFVLEKDLVLLSDEIYETILYDGAAHLSPAALSPEVRAKTVLINSLSKTYAMTGWRVGYCAAPSKLIGPMLLVLQQASRGPATFVQDAAVAALTGPQDCVAQMSVEYARRRAEVTGQLDGAGGCHVLAPEGGFFAMADITPFGLPSNEVRRRLLNDAGVVVAHGSAYGPGGEGLLRISFASGGAALQSGLGRLRGGLEALGAERNR